MSHKNIHDLVLELIPLLERDRHSNFQVIETLDACLAEENFTKLGESGSGRLSTESFGEINFPFYSLGRVKSYFHLEYREMVLFYLYKRLRNHYDTFMDVGGNLGLHSIFVAKLNQHDISYYEPDPIHWSEAQLRFKKNGVLAHVEMHQIGISDFQGQSEFVRVVDNTTASHIKGEKTEPYGPLNVFEVEVKPLSKEIPPDKRILAKLDIEGSEAKALSTLSDIDWENFHTVVEITNEVNAAAIFEIAKELDLSILSQKISWKRAVTQLDLPTNYKEGSVLITKSLKTSDLLG